MKFRAYQAEPQRAKSPSGELSRHLELPQNDILKPRMLIGRREWIALPDLGVSPLNAKTDSGARSSSIHAEDVEISPDRSRVKFVSINHYNEKIACEADVASLRRVRSSTGIAKYRVFIETSAMIAGGFRWKILASLANRSEMRCPMLLGRRALAGYFLIDPQRAHLLGPMRGLDPHRDGAYRSP